MMYFKSLRTTVCLAALLSGSAAMADVTAQQVWDDWKATLDIYGADGVSIGAEESADGVVTVSDLTLSMTDGDDSVVANLGTITFTEQGDGTVAVQMADSYPIDMMFDGQDSMKIEVNQSGMSMIVSGAENDMTYDVSADRYGLKVIEILESDSSVFDGDIMMTANNLEGTYNVRTDDLRHVDYDMTVGSLDLLADFVEPDGDGRVLMSGKMDAVTAQSQIAMPLDADLATAETMFMDGFVVAGGYGFSSANYIFDVDADGSQAKGSVSLGSGSAGINMDDKNLSYDIGTDGIALNVQTDELPFPIDVSLAEYGVGFAMPLSATDAPADFAMSLNLIELNVNDAIWDMGDPGKVLPRDPATIKLDLSGQGRWFFDLLDPEQADALNQADVPGELNALNLNDLLLSVGGAMVTGAGAFTFDNTDLDTFDGLPRPLGDASIQISGANGLIDNLVSMGLLPEDQASMGRLMMGMFARSTGDDQLETTVEVNAEGHLIVNGQRMQ